MKGVDERQARILLLDIEGTTTPIDFVYRTLFPYASRKIQFFLHEHSRDAEIQPLMRDLRSERGKDEIMRLRPPVWQNDSGEAQVRSCAAYVQWLIARDSKCTPLKSLQGKIWQEGFESGELRGQVYADVPRAFERWRRQKRDICIYSSGSVLAQQLLFRTAISGDLTPHIAGFFDTQTGIKTAPESYKKIAASLGRARGEFLFLSDAPKEVKAAQSAGMHAILCDRNVPTPTASPASEVIYSFDEVFPDHFS
jgi:enolase-phosphatase E1